MNWYQLAENPQALDSLYTTVPELENVELFSIYLHRDAARFQINFNLPIFPDKPSARWHKDFNTVQAQLAFSSITDFRAQGWFTRMKVNIEIKRRDGLLEVVIFNAELDLRYAFSSEFLRIEHISAYKNEIKIYPFDKR